MADYRRFEKNDWYAYAGAEKFRGGDEPLIYEKDLNDGQAGMDITVDKNGIEIHLFGKDGEDNIWSKEIYLTSIRAEGELRHLIEHLEKFEYAPDLAYELDHPTDKTTEGFVFC